MWCVRGLMQCHMSHNVTCQTFIFSAKSRSGSDAGQWSLTESQLKTTFWQRKPRSDLEVISWSGCLSKDLVWYYICSYWYKLWVHLAEMWQIQLFWGLPCQMLISNYSLSFFTCTDAESFEKLSIIWMFCKTAVCRNIYYWNLNKFSPDFASTGCHLQPHIWRPASKRSLIQFDGILRMAMLGPRYCWC